MIDDKVWCEIIEKLKDGLNPSIFDTYIKNLKPYKEENNSLTIIVEDDESLLTIQSCYLARIEAAVEEITNNNYTIKCILKNQIESEEETTFNEPEPIREIQKQTTPRKEYKKYDSGLIKDYTFDNYAMGLSNQIAVTAAQIIIQQPGRYNPLFLYGVSGIGKTHLAMAIGNEYENKLHKKVLYITSEKFQEDVMHIAQDPEEFKQKYRNVELLIIDDIQLLKGEKTQVEFFNIFNEICLFKKNQMVVISDRCVNDIKDLQERLQTRFRDGFNAEMLIPDDKLRVNIIKKYIERPENEGLKSLNLSEEVIQYIANNMNTNARSIHGALNQLLINSLIFSPETIDIQFVQKNIGEFLQKNTTTESKSIIKIQQYVADYFKISIDDLKGTKKDPKYKIPRHIAMYLCRNELNETFENIGSEFGKDHSTALRGIKNIEKLMDYQPDEKKKNNLENLKLAADIKNAINIIKSNMN